MTFRHNQTHPIGEEILGRIFGSDNGGTSGRVTPCTSNRLPTDHRRTVRPIASNVWQRHVTVPTYSRHILHIIRIDHCALVLGCVCNLPNTHTEQDSVSAHTHTRTHARTHAHTHTRLMALCPGLPGWAGTRKVRPIWILLKQETVGGSGISWAICKSAPRSRQITMRAPHHSVFTGRIPFLPPNQQRQSTEGNNTATVIIKVLSAATVQLAVFYIGHHK